MLGVHLPDAGGLKPLGKWVSAVVVAFLLVLVVEPALAVTQSDEALTLQARPIQSVHDSSLSLPLRPQPESSTWVYSPEMTPAVMTISAPTPAAEHIAHDPTGPSSLALVAIGLALAVLMMRNRQWVR